MARMIDLLRRGRWRPPFWCSEGGIDRVSLFASAREAEVVVIDNVARYLFEDVGQDKWTIADFPILRPPFQKCWFEYESPPFINSGGRLMKLRDDVSRTGCLIEVLDKSSLRALSTRFGIEALTIECIAYYHVFFEVDGRVVGPMHTEPLPLTADGEACQGWESMFGRATIIPQAAAIDAATQRMAIEGGHASLFPVFLALSFMHCKNVRTEAVPPTAKLSRAHLRRHGIPLSSYRVIHIDPMREVVRHEASPSQPGGLARALHIMRGHFKDYRDTSRPGLFGKKHGMWWWNQSLRGAAEHGRVHKTYEVDR